MKISLNNSKLQQVVNTVLNEIRTRGDEAVIEYEQRFDHCSLDSLVVSEKEIDEAEHAVGLDLKAAINLAHDNIFRFHSAQQFEGKRIETKPGVVCWQKSVAIEKVGLLILISFMIQIQVLLRYRSRS